MLLVYIRNSLVKNPAAARQTLNTVSGSAGTSSGSKFTKSGTNFMRFNSSSSSGSGSIPQLKSLSSLQQKIKSPKLSIVDFYATWCGPCKAVAPLLEEFSTTYKNVQFFKIDVDESPDVAQEYGVSAMPTFVLFKNNEILGKIVGANIQAIKNALDAHN